ncbi:hypothetical protein COO05_31855, partial [Bacillus toyonensis]
PGFTPIQKNGVFFSLWRVLQHLSLMAMFPYPYLRISIFPLIYYDINVDLNWLIQSKWFWCKDKIKENIAHIFLAELYFMLLAQTSDG